MTGAFINAFVSSGSGGDRCTALCLFSLMQQIGDHLHKTPPDGIDLPAVHGRAHTLSGRAIRMNRQAHAHGDGCSR
jgi:hypothetical protein